MFFAAAWLPVFCWVPLQMLMTLNIKGIGSVTINKSNKSASYYVIKRDNNILHRGNATKDESFNAFAVRDVYSQKDIREMDAESFSTLQTHNFSNETPVSETLKVNEDDITRNFIYVTCNMFDHEVSNLQYEGDPRSIIESKRRKLSIQNNTNREMFKNLTTKMTDFIELDDKVAEQAADNMTEEYMHDQNSFMNEIKELNTFIRKYKCTTGHENETIDEVSEKEYIDQFRTSEGVIKEYNYLRNIIKVYESYNLLHEEANNFTKQYNELHYISDLRYAVEKRREVKQKLQEIINEIKSYKKFAQEFSLKEYFVNDFLTDLLYLGHWENDLVNKTNELKELDKYAQEETFRIILQEYVQPIFQGIIFIIGFVGNAVLLLIFARHKNQRTASNMMLLNLALGDTLNLVVNIATFYTYFMSSKWTLGEGLCIVYRFSRQLCIGVSVYSVVIISVQRFFAVNYLFSRGRYLCRLLKKFETFLTIFSAWFIGTIIAIPHTVNAGIYEGNCYGASEAHTNYPKAITIFDFLAFCVIPFIIITSLSIISALKLKRSVRNMPGEKDGMEELKQARIISSNVLIALTIVFAVSYFPFYLFNLIFAWVDYNMDTSLYRITFFITYTLIFGNSCFNPIALYIASKKFRNYFNRYLLCRKKTRDEEQKQSSTATSSSNIETGL